MVHHAGVPHTGAIIRHQPQIVGSQSPEALAHHCKQAQPRAQTAMTLRSVVASVPFIRSRESAGPMVEYVVTDQMVGDRRSPGATILGVEFEYLLRQPSLLGPPAGSEHRDAMWTVYELASPERAPRSKYDVAASSITDIAASLVANCCGSGSPLFWSLQRPWLSVAAAALYSEKQSAPKWQSPEQDWRQAQLQTARCLPRAEGPRAESCGIALSYSRCGAHCPYSAYTGVKVEGTFKGEHYR